MVLPCSVYPTVRPLCGPLECDVLPQARPQVARKKQPSSSALCSEKMVYVPVIPDPRVGRPPHQPSGRCIVTQEETALTFLDVYVSVLLASYILDISVYL